MGFYLKGLGQPPPKPPILNDVHNFSTHKKAHVLTFIRSTWFGVPN